MIKKIIFFALQIISKFMGRRFLKRKEIFLNVGAGNIKGVDNWITIDRQLKCDIIWDLRKGIPFPTNSVSKIYSHHFLEHLTYKECQKFLDECLRVLKIGGEFSVSVPNIRVHINAYLNSDMDKKWFGYKPAYNNTTRIDHLNYAFYMDGHHKYMFDEENLIYILNTKFNNAQIREFDPDIDNEEVRFASIYARATKWE